MTDAILVLVTAPSEDKAAEIARTLVEEELAACGNIVPALRSIYRWEGKISDEAEALLILKTTAPLFDPLRARVVELHPYECPEVVQLAIDAAHEPYLQWLRGSVAPIR
jgi:periplasmic divalent cation tolerance protein